MSLHGVGSGIKEESLVRIGMYSFDNKDTKDYKDNNRKNNRESANRMEARVEEYEGEQLGKSMD